MTEEFIRKIKEHILQLSGPEREAYILGVGEGIVLFEMIAEDNGTPLGHLKVVRDFQDWLDGLELSI